MSTKEKLVKRIKTIPSDFSMKELEALLLSLGYEVSNKGKTSGSRIKFFKKEFEIMFHKPHDGIVKKTCLKEIVDALVDRGEI